MNEQVKTKTMMDLALGRILSFFILIAWGWSYFIAGLSSAFGQIPLVAVVAINILLLVALLWQGSRVYRPIALLFYIMLPTTILIGALYLYLSVFLGSRRVWNFFFPDLIYFVIHFLTCSVFIFLLEKGNRLRAIGWAMLCFTVFFGCWMLLRYFA
jgi:hypothetical protein